MIVNYHQQVLTVEATNRKGRKRVRGLMSGTYGRNERVATNKSGKQEAML